ncbi:putative Ig domain-containing protein [Labilibacter marinus]|uniref:putative Ig domain-containing protein n=1 Tax=Labilibacter marinus TaxID=1477105 RepID=UPI00094FCA5B|nr:putative Ig domain-containing protein [Labilibacter marinus]
MNQLRAIASLIVITLLFAGCTKTTKIYNPSRGEGMYVLTPKEKKEPKIHGASVFGVRPNSPFLYTIPATGEKPLKFMAEGLPEGISVNEKTGVISGKITAAEKKDYSILFKVSNALGQAERSFKIKVGDEICLTPPLGWNSWNCWSHNVSQKNVLASAKAMVDKGLKDYGWTYMNIDDVWQGERGGEYNAIQANPETFPNMKEMCDEIHAMGLKVGIYSTPWVVSYGGYIGGSSDYKDGCWTKAMVADKKTKQANQRIAEYTFDTEDAKQWAEWGIDYLKYDWNPNEPASTIRMADALKASGRDIVYSLSNTAPLPHAKLFGQHVNCFRTAGDLKDRWNQDGPHLNIREQWVLHRNWMESGFRGGPGHFPDPDMLVVGHVAPVGKDIEPKSSRLTADEQYSHISLWSLWSAPLLIGAPIELMDEFTVKLLTNSEVLAIQQDEKAIPAKSILRSDLYEIFMKDLADGSKAIGLFNIKDEDQVITLDWKIAGLEGEKQLRDIWRHQDMGTFTDSFSANVPPHGVVLVKIK